EISVAAAASPMDGCKSRKCAQQKKLEAEENTENIPMSAFFKQSMHELEDVTDDVDEIEILSQLDYHVSEKEEKLLLNAFFHKDVASIAKRLSEAITSSINKLEDKHIAATYEYPVLGSACISATDYYRKLGEFMSLYTHENWKSLLKLTQLESWSPNTVYKATNMFASSSKVERFYEIFLLPRALFKPKGLFYGILLPLFKSCTIPEAVIIGSIIQKFLFLKIYQVPPWYVCGGDGVYSHKKPILYTYICGLLIYVISCALLHYTVFLFVGVQLLHESYTGEEICAGSSSNRCGRCSLLEISSKESLELPALAVFDYVT
ncbi:hypothetical protein HID58_067140, partial [Brassica napus]